MRFFKGCNRCNRVTATFLFTRKAFFIIYININLLIIYISCIKKSGYSGYSGYVIIKSKCLCGISDLIIFFYWLQCGYKRLRYENGRSSLIEIM